LNLPEGTEQLKLRAEKRPMRLDVLAYEAGEGNPWADKGELCAERTFWAHGGVGIDGYKYVCPRKSADKPCPICNYISKLRKDPTSDEELIKELKPKERQIFNMIDLTAPEKGVQIFECSTFLFGALIDAGIDADDGEDGYDRYADFEEGMTLKVSVEEASFGGRTFPKATSIMFRKRDDYDADMEKQVHCLDDILNVLEYDELESIFLQDEQPKKSNDDSDDLDGGEIEEEEDGPEPPKKKKHQKRAKQDLVEDEDEEDEPQKKKKSTNKCPHGHTFGDDCNEHDECDDCDAWTECDDKANE